MAELRGAARWRGSCSVLADTTLGRHAMTAKRRHTASARLPLS